MHNQCSTAYQVLKLLNVSPAGLGAMQLMHELRQSNENSFRSQLSKMVDEGLVYVDGKTECTGCRRSHTCYRITDAGRLQL